MFIGLMTIFLSLLCMMVNNVVLWWSVLLMMTIFFVMLNKNVMSYKSMFNYFVFQESMGLLFLMLNYQIMQVMMLMLKIGVAPLHFWLFSVTNDILGWNLMWFLTFQKLPFVVIISQMMMFKLIFLFLLGIMVCLVQMMMNKSGKNLLILSSTESFNWILLSIMMSFLNLILIFFYYFMLMLIMIFKFENLNLVKFNWEVMLIFMNLPFTVNFFIKIMILINTINEINMWVLFLLFMMFMSVLSFGMWMVNLSVKKITIFKFNKWNYLFFLPVMIMIVI